jgi:threonine/homoserine/homoserine lactone efflux protein
MELTLFIKGLVIGLSLAVPVGPIALLCIRRTLTRGGLSGFASGLGAATADSVFACIAGFGLTFISNWLFCHELLIRLVGGVLLCYVGAKIFFSVPVEKQSAGERQDFFGDYVSTFLLTITNPLTILSFIAAFSVVGMGGAQGGFLLTAILVVGVFLGSTLWWMILSSLVHIFHGTLSLSGLQRVNRISGTLIAGFGLAVLFSVVV